MTKPEKSCAHKVGVKAIDAMGAMIPAWRAMLVFLRDSEDARDAEFAISSLAVIAASMRNLSMETAHHLQCISEIDPYKLIAATNPTPEDIEGLKKLQLKSGELARLIRAVTKDDAMLVEIAVTVKNGVKASADPNRN